MTETTPAMKVAKIGFMCLVILTMMSFVTDAGGYATQLSLQARLSCMTEKLSGAALAAIDREQLEAEVQYAEATVSSSTTTSYNRPLPDARRNPELLKIAAAADDRCALPGYYSGAADDATYRKGILLAMLQHARRAAPSKDTADDAYQTLSQRLSAAEARLQEHVAARDRQQQAASAKLDSYFK